MRFAAVAIDYDGTLAADGTVHPSTVAALEQVVASGRKFILVTGRTLRELLPLFPQASLCARIVAENGAVLFRPATRDQRLLTQPRSEERRVGKEWRDGWRRGGWEERRC